MEVEHRSIIKFLVEEGMKGMEIIDRLNRHSGAEALHRRRVYHRITDLKCPSIEFPVQ
jgi:hypothetical protein